jgi:hypothetical protein
VLQHALVQHLDGDHWCHRFFGGAGFFGTACPNASR